jgi:arylformamidase
VSDVLVSGWIDVSLPLRNGMVQWPGDPAFRMERFSDQEQGAPATVSRMSLSVHTGTHMDAPLHYIPRARAIDQMPIEATVGPARVIPIHDPRSIERRELTPHAILSGERILFRTANSDRCWNSDAFHEDYVFISPDAARHLVECGVRCVGIDYLSVDAFREDDGAGTHRILLAAGIWIVEGLNLRGVAPGNYELACLPLRLIGSDGAPARAILRPI